MKQFNCGDIVPGCDTKIEAESEDQILEQVLVHAREDHGMDEVPPKIQDRIRASIVEQ